MSEPADIVFGKHGFVHGTTVDGTRWLRCHVDAAAKRWGASADILPAGKSARGKRSWVVHDRIKAVAEDIAFDLANRATADGLAVITEAAA